MLPLLYFLFMAIILLLLIFKIYIKKLSSFWSIQPVFHAYNIFDWMRPNGIINTQLPEFNKFCNIINVQTKNISILTDLQRQKYTNFIKNHYLNTEEIKYLPTQNEIFPFFTGFNQPSYISINHQVSNTFGQYLVLLKIHLVLLRIFSFFLIHPEVNFHRLLTL